MPRYTVVLEPDPQGGGYSVSVPALPGCFSQGETLDEALSNVREAIALYVESLIEDGDPVPSDVTPLLAMVDVPLPEVARAGR